MPDALTEHLVAHSDLSGRRANLELALAFADCVGENATSDPDLVWELCTGMTAIGPHAAPTDHPREFIPFCGAVGIGALSTAAPPYVDRVLCELQRLANEPRWWLREAVCSALQRLIAAYPLPAMAALEGWVAEGS
jgi:hypothetical protein